MEFLSLKNTATEYRFLNEAQKECVIECRNGSLEELSMKVDLLVCSAFKNSYIPLKETLIGNLQKCFQVSVEMLSRKPLLDLRDTNGVWISQTESEYFTYLECVELSRFEGAVATVFHNMFLSIRLLEHSEHITSIALPLLGTGNQRLDKEQIFLLLLEECFSAFRLLPNLKKIILFEKDDEKYRYMNEQINKNFQRVRAEMVFISYSRKDVEIAKRLAEKLNAYGLKVWIDYEQIHHPNYGAVIVEGIEASAAYVILVSEASQSSVDVQRELFNAGETERIKEKKEKEGHFHLYPIIVDQRGFDELNSSFKYYLRGKDCCRLNFNMDLEQCLDEFCRKIIKGLEEE